MSIWQKLPKPFFVLAPMEDVTDTVFRQVIASLSHPDLFFTEFTNVEGMCSPGDKIVSQRLKFSALEKPIIAQVWGKKPEHYFAAAKRIAGLGFDGIDINMGCPEKSVIKNGCCAALINNPSLASEIIHATKDGAGKLPVSVKTRIGFNTIATDVWISFLLSHKLDALTIHGRTAKELSLVPCHWEEIGKAVILKEQINPKTIIIGNGDVITHNQGVEYFQKYKVDGIMIGRGVFSDPYIFSGNEVWRKKTAQERLSLLKNHTILFKKTWLGKKPAAVLKKYIKIYIQGFEGAQEIRNRFMETKTLDEILIMLDKQLTKI